MNNVKWLIVITFLLFGCEEAGRSQMTRCAIACEKTGRTMQSYSTTSNSGCGGELCVCGPELKK